MKILISHDVDHITAWEHKKDLIIPKFVIRNSLEFICGYISASEIGGRLKSLLSNRWNNLEELMAFDKGNNIPATFFVGVSNGNGLSYSRTDSESWIRKILEEGFEIGLHGIAFDGIKEIQAEHALFASISKLEKFGIRIHYLRNSPNTLSLLNKTGYLFDTSLFGLRDAFKSNDLWEFPVHIMDVNATCRNTRWQNQTLDQAKEAAKITLEKAFRQNIQYFTILFHDRYFHHDFKTLYEWYIWLMRYCKDNEFVFTTYAKALTELDGSHV